MRRINGYVLKQTCAWAPEQYDVFKDDKQVGYIYLKYGCFIVDHPKVGMGDENTVFVASPVGDETRGQSSFRDEAERMFYLTQAVIAIHNKIKGVGKFSDYQSDRPKHHIGVGSHVFVYDRYRFTPKPAKAQVERVLENGKGVEVKFTACNQCPVRYPIGSTTLVCMEQLKLDCDPHNSAAKLHTPREEM